MKTGNSQKKAQFLVMITRNLNALSLAAST